MVSLILIIEKKNREFRFVEFAVRNQKISFNQNKVLKGHNKTPSISNFEIKTVFSAKKGEQMAELDYKETI